MNKDHTMIILSRPFITPSAQIITERSKKLKIVLDPFAKVSKMRIHFSGRLKKSVLTSLVIQVDSKTAKKTLKINLK